MGVSLKEKLSKSSLTRSKKLFHFYSIRNASEGLMREIFKD